MIDTKNFTKLSNHQKENIYGGFAWMIVAFFAMQTIAQVVSTWKLASAHTGSFKQSGYEAHWDDKPVAGSGSKASTTEPKVTNVFYAY